MIRTSMNFTNLFKAAPILFSAAFIAGQVEPAFAQTAEISEQELLEQIDTYNTQGNSNSLNQVNSVFQLRDVSPSDWAFEALRNLVERYGCIAGYPDGTYRGNRSLTRYEFAAGLNACLQQIERLITANRGGEVTREDLATLQRLTQEFEAELATLGTRVDNLEGRVGFLEDNQFSTTTKLSGAVVFVNSIVLGDEKPNGDDIDSNIGFLYDTVLDLESSFTGRDELKVSLQASNFDDGDPTTPPCFEVTGSGTLDTVLDNCEATGGSFVLEDLIYSFPLGDNIQVAIGANDFDPDSTFDYNYGRGGELNDFILDGEEAITDGTGAEDGVGISTNIALSDRLSFGIGYTTNDSNATNPDIGLFQDYSAAAGLNYSGDNFDIGLAYNYTETVGDNTIVSSFIDNALGADTAASFNEVTQNSVGARGALRLGSRTEIGGFVEYIDLGFEDTATDTELDTDGWSFGANLAFFDIGKEGSKLGIAFASRGQFEDAEISGAPDVTLQEDRTYIAEVSYDFPVNNNVFLTPGFFAVFNPNRDQDNDTVYVGVLRTSFFF
ncbi:cyanobacterial porin [Halothece sp. PCC 7418]|uniref:iron uptake porin n=1 Tax=Halothece sp. (strain PCC 7418) TaxID=65093 RepID=UPI0002A0816A|nr:iron uptake porin [Halothece sp. PCC 7418]AFZ45566.1 cyanobacterial porin [Halothece sp. PCC 7418]